jgi:polyvinyl alcohol dehydrogenase (cytochrome)
MKLSVLRAARPVPGALAVLAAAALIAGCSSAVSPAPRKPKPTPTPTAAVTASDWSAYLDGPMHSSYNATQTAITPASVPALVEKWHHAPGHNYLSSPTVADGAVFIGSDAGWFYKLSETTGAVLDKVFLGYQPTKTCGGRGMVDTATVALDPANHQPTVYVGGPDGYLYAFSAANLSLVWKSVIAIPSKKISNFFEWSSPTVTGGKIYIGVSSNCDNPLVYAGLIGYDQVTGKKFAEFHTIPKGDIGASIWSSIAVAPDGDVYASTGNGPETEQLLGYSDSILKFTPDLKLLGSFQIPAAQVTYDGDFGGSPVFFGNLVGACDKNGIFYALNSATMKVVWEQRIGAPSNGVTYSQCSAAPIYNGTDLYFAGPAVTINGTTYQGSVQERMPSDGKLVWETGLPNGVIGSPTLDGGGVIALGTYDTTSTPNETYLVDAATGKILRTLVKGTDFAQSVFANGWLFTANTTGVYAWGP